MGCKTQIFRVRGDSLDATSFGRNSTSGDHIPIPRTIKFFTGVKRAGHFLDPQRDLWNVTDILRCGKEFVNVLNAVHPRRRSKVSAARGQNAKGHFSKIALKKKFNNSLVRGGKNQGAEIFFLV